MPYREIIRSFLPCLPWVFYNFALVLGFALQAGILTKSRLDAMIWIMILVASVPGWLLILFERERWLVRSGWWIPLGLLAWGIAAEIKATSFWG